MVALRLSALAATLATVASLAQAVPTDAQVARLFSRQDLEIGSDAWKAQYPPGGSVPKPKQAWIDALDVVVKQGLIPDIPVATLKEGWPSYSDGVAPADPSRCHYTVGCTDPTDIIDAPAGYIGISQDDGPLEPGRELNSFFEAEKIAATHFYIGANVVSNYDIALQALGIPDQHLAVHTWTHGYSSGQTNEELLGELGWTMQVLADINGGRIPAYWRPPFGDVDNRVRAIAHHVFGLRTVIWGTYFDSEDWTLGTTGTLPEVQNRIQGFVDGPKSPGLIMLEHELYDGCVTAFKAVYPSMISNGWNLTDIPGLWDLPKYKNALTGESDVISDIGITNTTVVVLSPAASSTAASSSPSSVGVTSSASASSMSSATSSAAPSTSQASSASPSSTGTSNEGTSASGQQSPTGGTSAGAPVVRHSLGLVFSLASALCASLFLS